MWYKYPVHVRDEQGLLDHSYTEGSRESNLKNQENRGQELKLFERAFEKAADEDGEATALDMAKALGMTKKTVYEWLKRDDISEKYFLKKGTIRHKVKSTLVTYHEKKPL